MSTPTPPDPPVQEAPTTTLPKVASPPRKSAERISPGVDSVQAVTDRLTGGRRPATERNADGAALADPPTATKKFAPTATAGSKPAVDAAKGSAGGLRAQVQIRWVDPWTVLKVTGAVMVLLFVAWMIGVAILYALLEQIGAVGKINSSLNLSSTGQGADVITVGKVFGYAALIGIVSTVLVTALVTVSAFIFNLCADLIGGVEVTLADPD